MISAAKWARENKIPYLNLSREFQVAVIEYARNVLRIENANSIELDETVKEPVVVYMPEISRHTSVVLCGWVAGHLCSKMVLSGQSCAGCTEVSSADMSVTAIGMK